MTGAQFMQWRDAIPTGGIRPQVKWYEPEGADDSAGMFASDLWEMAQRVVVTDHVMIPATWVQARSRALEAIRLRSHQQREESATMRDP